MTKLRLGAAKRRPAANVATKVALAALLASASHSAFAAEFTIGDDINVTTNVILRAGVSIRTEEQDPRNVSGSNAAAAGQNVVGRAFAQTEDDGNLNFDKGDIVSAPISVLADVDFNTDTEWGTIGLFLRGKALSDLALEFTDVAHGHNPNGYEKDARLDDEDFANLAKFTHAELLDAFVYTDFDIGDIPVTFRLGRQVLSWGESALIQGGINSINPVDVSAFRRPGVELKEGLLPVGMAYLNVGVTENMSIEGFLQYEHQQTVLDGCGTFFSTNDFVPEGCDFVVLGESAAGAAVPGLTDDAAALESGLGVSRRPDVEPDQYALEQGGVAIRYYEPTLDTEFGLYWHRTHNKTPNVGAFRGQLGAFSVNVADVGCDPGDPLPCPVAPIDGFAGLGDIQPSIPAAYAEEIVEDLDLFGLSFATNIEGYAVAAEVSFRPEQPVQINANQILASGLTDGNSGNAVDAIVQALDVGEFASGYSEAEQLKGQISVVGFYDQVLGASRWTVLGEAGFEHLNIDDVVPGLIYGRATSYGDPDFVGDGGTITDFSWGYRLRAIGSYPNAFMGVNVTPSVTFTHDVEGTSSDGQFNDNRKGVGFNLAFNYLQTYTVEFGYSNFFDGDYNLSDDRDFASASAKVQF